MAERIKLENWEITFLDAFYYDASPELKKNIIESLGLSYSEWKIYLKLLKHGIGYL